MTHSEMTHWWPSPDGVGYSSCPGEMVISELSQLLAGRLADAGRTATRRTELWHCERCGHTIVAEVDARGARRIRNAYPAPSIPPLKISPLT